MEGKGWFVIYGLLLFCMFYLFLAQRELGNRLEGLESQLNQDSVAAEPTPEESVALDPILKTSPSPDLTSPETRDKKRKDDLHIIKTNLFKYQDEKKRYPTELSELQGIGLDIIPSDPLSPKYRYRYRKTDKGFLLTCYLENKEDADDKKSDGKADQVYTLSEQSR